MRGVDLSVSYTQAVTSQPDRRKVEDARVAVVPEKRWPAREIEREAYLPSAELQRVTDLALALGRPLLLQGEPGCGKTRLSHSVAFALGLPLEVAYVKSTSRAQDLLYVYDAVRRLYDAQLGAKGPVDRRRQPLARNAANYIRLGPLGKAIARASYGRRSVVLIDEIDKADLDFPNDLLWELDRMEFEVPEAPELGRQAGELRPIVVITHNEEKPLPPAFLRRCIYHYVEFPKTVEELERILALHGMGDASLARKAAEVALALREKGLNKRPGLTEVIDWVFHEQARGTTADQLADLPNLEAMLKDRTDQERAARELATT